MKLNPFKNNSSGSGKKNDKSPKEGDGFVEKEKDLTASEMAPAFKIQGANAGAYKVLKNFYISEKASLLNGFNQYVFKVFRNANKSQIKTQVGKIFNVKVKDVKILNMPRKRRDLGRHPGFRSDFKKAIVVLEKGQTIEQAKP